MEYTKLKQKYQKLLTAKLTLKNRTTFLANCIDEMVIPKSIAKHFQTPDHIFPRHAKDYLHTEIQQLKNKEATISTEAKFIKTTLQREHALSHEDTQKIDRHLKNVNTQQHLNHSRKLTSLIDSSQWKLIGRQNLVLNISNRTLSPTEHEALSLGLKYATGIQKKDLTQVVTKNYRHLDSDFQKGMIQGIITASINHNDKEHTLPLRYINALKTLSKDTSIHISTSDKGGES